MTPELLAQYLHHIFWFLFWLMFAASLWGVVPKNITINQKKDKPEKPPEQ